MDVLRKAGVHIRASYSLRMGTMSNSSGKRGGDEPEEGDKVIISASAILTACIYVAPHI